MAYTYEREDSPWVWICFLDDGGKRRRQATEIRKGTPDTKRKSKNIKAEFTAKETELPRVRAKHDAWENWVPSYFEERYQDAARTLRRAREAWVALSLYLESRNVRAPRGVDYAVVSGYMSWRQSAKSGMRAVKHNTAMLEISFLRVVMAEAVRRGYASTNPCRELEISKAAQKSKREITTEEESRIDAALPEAHQWMRESWQVYMRQGCRLSEVEVPLDRIDEHAKPVPTITFKLKGGRLHTTALHPDLLPLVELARAEKRAVLVKVGAGASKIWKDFFGKLKIKDVSIHCTRVTVITRLVRKGADPVFVREYIGHSSDVIQAIYRRLRPSDASALTRLLGTPQSMPTSESPDVP